MIKNGKSEGSVTVFLSCVLLLIIVLTCTVIDGTRIQIAKMQALRALRSATSSALASYDSGLSHEYGVFAREEEQEPLREQIKGYALATLQPENNLPDVNMIQQAIYPKPPLEPLNILKYNIDITSIKPTGALVEHNTDYLKLQIMEYMKYRGPMLLVEPFLEKLELMSKSAKTTKFIQKKMEVEKQVTEIDDLYLELEKYIDGLNINRKGRISYQDFFVKKLAINQNQHKIFLKGIPRESVADSLDKRIYRFYEEVDFVRLTMKDYDGKRAQMVEAYRNLHTKRQVIEEEELALSQLENERYSVVSELQSLMGRLGLTAINMDSNDYQLSSENSSKIDQLRSSNESLSRDIIEKETSINGLREEEEILLNAFRQTVANVEHLEASMIGTIDIMRQMVQYIEPIEKALAIIAKIEKESNTIKGSITSLEKSLEKNKDMIIESTATSMLTNLKELKGRLAIPSDDKKTYRLVQNVMAMKDELKINLSCIKNTYPIGESFYKYYLENYCYYRVYGLIQPETELELLQSFVNEGNSESGSPYVYKNDYIEKLRIFKGKEFTSNNLNYLDDIVDGLAPYDYEHMTFQYGDMKNLTKEEKEKQDPREEAMALSDDTFIAYEEHDVSREVDKNSIPSVVHTEMIPTSIVTQEEVDFIREKKNSFMDSSLGMFSDMADKIGRATINLRDELYINEYIMGQFASQMDQLQDSEAMTLSGYDKGGHYLNNEVEYVLRGSLQEDVNVKYVTHTIVGIRFVMNYLHLLTNTEKRTMIMSIATAIAGWWTFGLGVYIVAALIMAAWSYVESMVDLRYLLEGKGVPFLKTRHDWYTSYNGIINGVIDEATEYAIDHSARIIDSLSGGVKDQVSYISDRFDSQVGNYVEKEMEELLGQAERTIQYAFDDVDRMADQVINDAFNHIRENIREKPTVRDYMNVQGDSLASHLIATIYRDYANRIADASYGELLSIKKEIMDKAHGVIEATKTKIISRVTNGVESISDQFESEVNKLVKETASKYKDVTKKEIKRITNDIQKNMSDNLDEGLRDVSSQTKGKKYASLMPSFSYNDYLRLMLLIGVNDDVKLYRVLDLIQFNLRDNRQDKSLILTDYDTGYEVTADVSVNYIFFGLPFMPDKMRDKARNSYKFTISTSMTY